MQGTLGLSACRLLGIPAPFLLLIPIFPKPMDFKD